MKKVLIFSHAAVLEVNRDLFYALARQHDVELRIACPRAWRGDLIRDLRAERNSGCPQVAVVSLPVTFSGNGSLFRYRASAEMSALEEWKPDLVFVDEEPWSLACRQIYRSFPKAELVFYTKQNLRKRVPFPFSRIQRKIFSRSAAAFAVSDEVASTLRWKGCEAPIQVLPHSYDPARFRPPGEGARARNRAELGLDPAGFVVGYFGRLDPEKGIDDLCGALEKIPAGVGGALFVGNGPLASRVDQCAARVKEFSVVRRSAIPHDRVGQTLGAIDVLVLPSRTMPNWKEQFGRILVEAMACGAAVIGSDSGEIPHLIGRAGGGLVFREGDVAGLARAISGLAQDHARLTELRANGRAYVESELAHEHVARRLGTMLKLTPRAT